MEVEPNSQLLIPLLSDKDYQLVSKTFRKTTELFYENPHNQEQLDTLICITKLVPMIVPSKISNNGLTIMSQIQILKAKTKNVPVLSNQLSQTIAHLKNPQFIPLKSELLVQALQTSELFALGCTVMLRYFNVLRQDHSLDWSSVIDSISQKIYEFPHLSIDLLNELCKNNQQNVKSISKSGIFKYISMIYISENLKDKFHLYRALKLIRSAAVTGTQVIRDRENVLAVILLTYEQYTPIVSDIFAKCYEEEYCSQIMKKDIQGDFMNYVYGWSHIETFCQHHLSQTVIDRFIECLQKPMQSAEVETKVFTILSNYSKFCKAGNKNMLKSCPHYQQSLLSYLKLCLSTSQVLPSTPYLINWNQLNGLISSNSNPKVSDLTKYLKELMSKEVKVGVLSANMRKLFTSQKNTDLMLERASKKPNNNEQLQHLKDILSQKERSSEHDSDTLRMAKQKAISSIKNAIAHETKLDINSILKAVELDDVHLLAKLLQAVELYLVVFEDGVDIIDLQRILEIIRWIEDHYKGQIIDWGSISQLLLTLVEQDEWKKHLKTFPKYCFWLLSIESFSNSDEKELWGVVKRVPPQKMNKKLPFVLGFLGKVLSNVQKGQYLKSHSSQLHYLINNLARNSDYELNAMMLSYFLRGWGEEEEDYQPAKYRKSFDEFIAPIDSILSSHLHLIPQDYYLLESCLPYKIHIGKKVVTDLESLVQSNGRLASYIYQEEGSQGKKVSGPIVSLNSSNVESLHQSMLFSQKNPNLIKANQLSNLVNTLSNSPKSYWQLYPRYVDIVGNLISVLGNSESSKVQGNMSDLSQKLISHIISNPNITDDERQQLLQEVRDCFQNMKERGVYIQIERIKKIVTKIVEKEIRDEIIVILNNYQVKEQQNIEMKMIGGAEEEQEQEEKDRQKGPFLVSIPPEIKANQREYEREQEGISIRQSTVIMVNQNQEQEEAYSSVVSMEKQFQSVKTTNSSKLLQLFEILKKIVNKQLPFLKFQQIYPILEETIFNESEKELLGSLLAQLYHQQNSQDILNLLLNKDKTIVSKEKVYELVSTFIPAFALSRRWKLVSRQYLDIAMKRVTQGFLGDGCQVAHHNLVKTADLEYFYSKKYHHIVLGLAQSAKQEDDIAHLLSLIGMAARFPQIKNQWVAQQIHLRIFKFITLYSKSVKIIGNLSFALSSLTFQESKACVDIVKQTETLYLMLDSLLLQPTNLLISQYGSLFIGNLSFSKCFDSCPNFDLQKVITVLLTIFEANLSTENMLPYKHLLKGLGNMSLIAGCTSMILNQQFCRNMVKLAEKVDIFTFYDEKKGKLIKLLLDLISNLATNRQLQKLQIFHQSKITLLTVTILEIIETTHSDIIASCIDAIDAICQDSGIETWYVSDKKLASILLDVLKLQSEDKLIVKSVRLITNLTLHENCIVHILKSNILGVIANVVMPQLSIRANSEGNAETNKKVEVYILKIMLRIYQIKPRPGLELILKSGFLDCLIRMIESTDVDQKVLDILFHYSPHIPNFLNKRTFSILIKVLTKKVNNQQILLKCLLSLKNILSFTYDIEEEDNIIEGIPQMYLKFLSTQFKIDALFLLAYHLLRSRQFREVIKKPDDKLQQYLRTLAREDDFSDLCRAIFFLIYSRSPMHLFQDQQQGQQLQYYQILKKGFRCKLYRTDGSFKEAIIDIDDQYNFRVYKYPDGEIKKKYVMNLRHIREFQMEYQSNPDLWKQSVFMADKGFFNTHESVNTNCCTIVSNSKWGEIHIINIEFNNFEDKMLFFRCFSHLLQIFRL